MAKSKDSTATNSDIQGAITRVGALGPFGPMGAGKSLAKVSGDDYAIIAMAAGGAGEEIRTALAENLGGAKLSAFDFQRIRVPAGGGLAWTMVDADTGEEKPEQSFEGIIVAFSDQKAFWRTGLDEAGAVQGPPNCHSTDCVQGRGDPGVLCAQCPNNVFGTAKKGTGRGKACKDVRLLFVCRPGDILPELLPVPPTSLKGVRDYFLRLAVRGIPYWRAVTRFALVRDQNAAGIKYAKVSCEPVGVLGDQTSGAVRDYSGLVRNMLGQAPALALKAADFNPEGETVDGAEVSGSGGGDSGADNRANDVM